MQGNSPNRISTSTYVAVTAVLMLTAPAIALADSTDCAAGETSLSCRLLGLLHWLEAAAFVLVLVLLVVIGVAVHLFRKNRLSRKGGR